MSDVSTVENTITKLKMPSMYNVVLINDDHTPMEFVILILMQFFDKDKDVAIDITMNVHTNGRGVAGTYTHEIATYKQSRAMEMAERSRHPLQIIIEPA